MELSRSILDAKASSPVLLMMPSVRKSSLASARVTFPSLSSFPEKPTIAGKSSNNAVASERYARCSSMSSLRKKTYFPSTWESAKLPLWADEPASNNSVIFEFS